MKNTVKKILFCAAIVVVVIAATMTVSGSLFTAHATQPLPPAVFETTQMKELLADYVGGADGEQRLDRTPFSEGEKKAAQYLKAYMDGLGGFETELQPFEYEVKISSGGGFFMPKEEKTETFTSQNVVAVRRSKETNAKNVIIGANYDNQFSALKAGSSTILEATKGHGALMNGTGVATLMALADKLKDEELPFDLYIVFFGAGELMNFGASKFVDKNYALAADTALMINLQHIGGDNTYIYCDEVRTDHEDFLLDRAALVGAGIKKVPSTLPVMSAEYLDGLAYAHYAMIGASAPFANANVPYANIFGGTFDTFSLSLDEMKGKKNVMYTENDNIAYLDENMPLYASKMASTAEAVYAAVTADTFMSAIENTKTNKFDYSVLMKRWIPSVIVIGTIAVFALLLIPVARHFEKKYPYKPQVKRVKVAVFGIDYENPSDGDVFIDVRKSDDPKNPFDGY